MNLYCKRDDLTGFGFGGNKTRKLDYLTADALAKGADTFVTVGAIQSNFCRIAAAAGRALGVETHLVLGGTKERKVTGNLLLDHLFGATVHFVDSEDWSTWEERAKNLSAKLTSEGKKVFQLPIGGSTPIGALGYVAAFYEILEDAKRIGVRFDTIMHASSSGGTHAGLIVGQALTGWNGKIVALGVAQTKDQLSEKAFSLASTTARLFDLSVDRSHVIVDHDFMGAAYAARTEACENAIKVFAQEEGIVLDHVYSGKAAAGVLDYARRKLFATGDNVLFIHTGGNIEMFE